MPTSSCPSFLPDMTSLTTSGRRLQRKTRRNCRLRRLQVKFIKKVLCEDHQISHCCHSYWPHNSAGYDIAICFRSAATCNTALTILYIKTRRQKLPDVGLLQTAVFSGKTSNGILSYVLTFVRRRRSSYHKVSGSNISRTVCPIITKFYMASMASFFPWLPT